MKRLKRLLAVIMAIICAGSIANFDVKAEGLKINEKHKKAKIIREIKELKTKTSSTYQLDNGARLLKVNLGSEDSEMEKNGGNLKKITKDGRKKLKELDVRNVSNYLMSNSSETQKNNNPKELSETQGVVMENEQKIIEFTPTDSEGKKTKVDENCITYKMKDGKIDYKYLSYENGVKEEIILNEKVENNIFSFKLKKEDIKLEKDDVSKEIKIIEKENGEAIAYIAAPNIKDNGGILDYDNVHYEIKEEKEEYIISVVVNQEYLNDKERMYPITIDPTMVWMDNRLQSALVSSFTGHRNVNIINGENIEVQNCGRNFAPYTNTEYMCFISTEGLPYTGNMDEFYGARIESANLKIVESADVSNGLGIMEIKAPKEKWKISEVTWNNRPDTYDDVWAEFASAGVKNRGHNIDLTKWAQAVSEGKIENTGLVLRARTKGTRAYFYGSSLNNQNYMQLSIVYWPYVINVNNYYDQAFSVRYSFDKGHSESIQEANKLANEIFKEVLGIYAINNEPQQIVSLADKCKIESGKGITKSSIDEICSEHNIKCTDPYEMYDDFISKYPGSSRNGIVSILWTGNKLFDSNGNEANRSFRWYSNGIFMQNIFESNIYFKSMVSCLVHEKAHIYGAPDHYHEWINEEKTICRGGERCKTCHPDTGRNESCLMNVGWIDNIEVENKNTLFCDECVEEMKEYVAKCYKNK